MNPIASLLFIAGLMFAAYFFLRSKPWLSRAERARNDGKRPTESEEYVKVTVMFGGKPVQLLMTHRELAIAKARAERQPEEFEP